MGWNGDNGEIISKAPTRQYREGFDAINWSKRPDFGRCDCGARLIAPPDKQFPWGKCEVYNAITTETRRVPTPEYLKGSIYDQDGEVDMVFTRGRGPTISVEDEAADVSPVMWNAIEKQLDDAQPKGGTWWCVVHERPITGRSDIAINSPDGRTCGHANFSNCQAKFYRRGKSDKITIT